MTGAGDEFGEEVALGFWRGGLAHGGGVGDVEVQMALAVLLDVCVRLAGLGEEFHHSCPYLYSAAAES